MSPHRPQATSEDATRSSAETVRFRDLLSNEALLAALDAVGYEAPSPIQAATIPPLLAGADLLGQAQTGTGKTAAFALPILSRIELARRAPQALVLVPTRELAIQVAEAFQRYAAQMSGFHVMPIYGGQSYTPQLQTLRRGVHVVVGTPGRIMDHIKRGTLNLETLKHFVLDEADEMLRMGFIDDVEWILEQAPQQRQIALFSATMPAAVRRIAQKHLHEPAEVTIKSRTTTASGIRQRYWIVSGVHKLDALTRILEAEPFDGMLVFARTKIMTEELAQKLQARGFAAEALNGDIAQAQRERTVARLKSAQIDIVVATDVAARGLDVERVSHVVNYDVPHDPESYVHRIGRTGRAGRSGEAILFVAPRERSMLRVIERTTRQSIEPMQLPSIEDVNQRRIARFNDRITQTLANGVDSELRAIVEAYEQQQGVSMADIAAALASIAQGRQPLLLDDPSQPGRRSAERARATQPSSSSRGGARGAAAGLASAERAVDRPSSPRRDSRPELRPQEPPPKFRPASAKPLPGSQEASRTQAGFKHRGLPDEHARKPARGASLASEPGSRPARQAKIPPSETFGKFGEQEASRNSRIFEKGPRGHDGTPGQRAERAPGKPGRRAPALDAETYRIEVGEVHGVKPANIVGAIASEAGLDGRHIGRVVIREDHSFIDLPVGMPKEIFRDLQKTRVAGQKLQISRALKTQVDKMRRERPSAPGRTKKR